VKFAQLKAAVVTRSTNDHNNEYNDNSYTDIAINIPRQRKAGCLGGVQ